MPELQEATVGYGGEFHLHDGAALYELVEVRGFKIPDEGTREQVETTHLKSPNWRREYVSTFYEDSDFDVTLNSRVRSTTDTLLSAALAAGDERAFKVGIPEDGVVVTEIEGTARCIGYSRGEVTPDGVIEATATFRIVTIDAPAAAA